MQKKLYRSRDERMIWGICTGLGAEFNALERMSEPLLTVRIAAVLDLGVDMGKRLS